MEKGKSNLSLPKEASTTTPNPLNSTLENHFRLRYTIILTLEDAHLARQKNARRNFSCTDTFSTLPKPINTYKLPQCRGRFASAS